MTEPKASRLRGALKRAGWAALAGAVVVLLLLAGLRGLAVTQAGRSLVEAQVEKLVLSGQRVEIDGLEGDLLGAFRIVRLRILDAQGEWLTLEGVAARWSPLALWHGEIRLETLDMASVVAARRPFLETAQTQGRPSPIHTMRLDAFDLARIELAPDLLLRPGSIEAVFRATGGAALSQAEGQVRLKLVPQDAAGDAIDADLSWSKTQPLTGHLAARGPAGGLLAMALGLDGDGAPAFDLSASHTGATTNFSARLMVSDVLAASLMGEWSPDALSGQGDLRADLLPTLSAVDARLGGPLTVVASGDATTTVIEATAPSGRAIVILPLDPRHPLRAIETAKLDLLVTDPARAFGAQSVGMASFRFTGDARQSDDTIGLEGVAALQQAAFGAYSVDRLSGPVSLRYERSSHLADGKLDLVAEGFKARDGAQMAMIGALPSASLAATYDTTSGRLDITQARLLTASGTLQGRGVVDLGSGTFELGGSHDVSAAAFVKAMPTSRAVGLWTAVRQDNGPMRSSLHGNLTGIEVEDAGLQAALGRRLNYSGQIQLAGGVVSTDRLVMRGAALRADLKGQVSAQQIDSTLALTSPNANIGGAALNDAAVAIRICGAPSDLMLFPSFSAQSIEIAGETFSDISLRATGRYRGGNLEGKAGLNAGWRGAPLLVSIGTRVEGERWSLDDLDLGWSGLSVRGTASGVGAGREDLVADLTVTSLPGAFGVPVKVEGRARLTPDRLTGQFDLGGLTYGPLTLAASRLDISGDRAQAALRYEGDGQIYLGGQQQPLGLNVAAAIDVAQQTASLTYDAALGEVTLVSAQPLVISRDPERRGIVAIGSADVLGGSLQLDIAANDNSPRLDVQWSELALGPAGRLLGRFGLRGTSSGSLVLSGDGGPLKGDANVRVDDLSSQTAPELNVTLDLVGALDGQDLRAQMTVGGSGDLTLAAEVRVDVDNPGGLAQLRRRLGGQIEAKVAGGGALEPLWALFGPTESRFVGQFSVDAALSGAGDDLTPSGTAGITGAEFEDGTLGLRLKDISARAALRAGGIEVSDFSARGGKGGRVAGAGLYAFDGGGDVDLTLDRLSMLQRQDVEAVLSGTLALSRKAGKARLDGSLRVDEARIDTERLPQDGYVTMDVRFKGDVLAKTAEPAPRLPLNLDIDITADRRIQVVGNGIDAEWAADLKLAGTLSQPLLLGTARIVRGTLDIVGRKFAFSESSVRFDGNPRSGQLAIRAVRATGDLDAVVSVTGTVVSPKLGFTSDPLLPEDEVFARVLFGRSVSQLSAIEAAQLAGAFTSLSGGNAFNLTSQLEAALGVDRIDFGIGADGSAQVATGAYIGDDVYLEVRADASGLPGVNVEWTPRANVEVSAEVEATEAAKFKVQWKRDYGD